MGSATGISQRCLRKSSLAFERERLQQNCDGEHFSQYTNIMHYIRVDRYRYSDSMMSKTDCAAETVCLETDKCHCLHSAIFSAIQKKQNKKHFLHNKKTDQNTVVALLTIAIKKERT